MSTSAITAAVDQPSANRILPLLLLLFVGSGCAALIYEIVWFQLLQLTIGSTAVSLGVLLATFMGGMCIGSLALPRYISRSEHPLRVYAKLELGIGAFGIALLFLVPMLGKAYSQIVGHGPAAILLRGLFCAVLLLPPTILMGATLPAIARWIQTTRNGVAWLGFFYGGNIAGAVFGCLLAGFYLLRVHDMPTATVAAALLNAAVAMLALSLASRAEYAAPSEGAETVPSAGAAFTRDAMPVYITIGLSGLTALGAEVIWTRVLGLLLGPTVYTFSIILAVFLVGLGIGSTAGSALSRRVENPRLALGLCQLLLTVAISWTAYMVGQSVPYWPVDPQLSSTWYNFQIDIVRATWAMLPPALLWGASFPLALASVARPGQDPGHIVGRVYAANTVGAILGSLGAGLVLVTILGTRGAQQILIGLAAISALIMLAPVALGARTAEKEAVSVPRPTRTLGLVIAAAAVLFLSLWVKPIPPLLIAYGRFMVSYLQDQQEVVYVGEGMNSSVAVTQFPNGVRNFHVSGKIEASSLPQDMRLQRMLGQITALSHPNPETVLVVGFGAGVTAGTFVLHPGVKRIVICEIEPLIPRVISGYFSRENYDVVNDPRVEIVYDDARHFILTTDEKFDVITSDPIHPWVKGSATLYTTEYFELAKKRLNPGGVMTQWVPLYESDEDVVRSELATFFQVYPGGSIFANELNGRGYDVVLLGREDNAPLDIDAIQQRLDRQDQPMIAASLREVGFYDAADLYGTYAGRDRELQGWLAGAEINRDRNLRLQYLAGLRQNLYMEAQIYSDMLRYKSYPEDLFVGSPESLDRLRNLVMR